MPDSKAKKSTSTKAVATSKPATTKATPNNSSNDTQTIQPERQSQFATILIGLLIIASGLLIYNYFQSVNAPNTTTTTDQKKAEASPTPTATPVFTAGTKEEATQSGSYTVQSGDSLWTVAEKVYGDGHQWGKIADANSLPKDSLGRPVVEVGQKLKVPDSAASTSKDDNLASNVTPTPTPAADKADSDGNGTLTQTPDTAISTYTVKHGDSLWGIAEQVYGHGEQWTLIANDAHNNLGTLPNGRPLIHAGNELYIPQAN